LTDEHEMRIRDRGLRGQETTKAAALQLAAERDWTPSMAYWLARRTRLALAVRDADGETLVPEDILDDLPRFAGHVAEVLRRTGMLGPRRRPVRRVVDHRDRPAVKLARSCRDCDCWGVHHAPRCGACRPWRSSGEYPIGDCARCRREHVPLRDGRCRACTVHISEHGPEAAGESCTQLWLGGELSPKLRNHAGALSYVVPHHRRRERARARRPAPPPVSPHLVDPTQQALFEVRRNWSCIGVGPGSLERLPSLTPAAAALLGEFQQYANDRHWDKQLRRLAARTLRIVLSWVGAEAPIPEADVRALPPDRRGTNARRAVEFLAFHGMLIPDLARQIDVHEGAIDRSLLALPTGIAAELHRWVEVLRGEGRRPHPARSFETIRKYLGYLHPVLQTWATCHGSLREITADEVRDAVSELTGTSANDRIVALRSLFRALKQERLIFRDPARGLTQVTIRSLPAPISTDRLRGLLERLEGALARLVVALVAIHGLGASSSGYC
jgi:hypothetical protein